ncbi:hypothetical protein HK096_009910, partial [Nowakowskiella sp. JEL0078]
RRRQIPQSLCDSPLLDVSLFTLQRSQVCKPVTLKLVVDIPYPAQKIFEIIADQSKRPLWDLTIRDAKVTNLINTNMYEIDVFTSTGKMLRKYQSYDSLNRNSNDAIAGHNVRRKWDFSVSNLVVYKTLGYAQRLPGNNFLYIQTPIDNSDSGTPYILSGFWITPISSISCKIVYVLSFENQQKNGSIFANKFWKFGSSNRGQSGEKEGKDMVDSLSLLCSVAEKLGIENLNSTIFKPT